MVIQLQQLEDYGEETNSDQRSGGQTAGIGSIPTEAFVSGN